MDFSGSTFRDEPPLTTACSGSASLNAYFDGELDSAGILAFEKHLADCDACRAELDDLRELSMLAKRVGHEGMSAASLQKIHRAIDFEEGYSVFRIAAALTGLAASAVIIGSVWLSEIPASRPPGPFVVITDTDTDSAWTRVAVNINVDPLPKNGWDVRDQQMVADARLADWMLNGLSGKPR